ncbi:MAG: carbohydrate ABC transporter permease [Candidatus Humimicrobiaceae bacterium]
MGQRFFLYFALASRMIAPTALVVPFMIISRRLHILDTFQILIIVDTYMWLPFLIWLMKGFIDVIPDELVEAAKIDGCSNFGILRKVIIPLCISGLVSVGILIFIDTWNELLFASALAASVGVRPITTTMTYFYTDVYTVYGWMTAAGMVGVIPAVIFTLFFQKYIVKGVMAGAVKG